MDNPGAFAASSISLHTFPTRNSLVLAAVCGFVLTACSGASDDEVFTLYRNSVTDVNMRIYVATFDANDKEDYNRGNCEQALLLFQNQPGVKTKFWCEKGRYRK